MPENMACRRSAKRLFIVGVREDQEFVYNFPIPTHEEDSFVTIRDAIGDLPEWPDGEFNKETFHWYYLSRNRYRGWEETSRTIVARARHIPLHPISPKLIRIHTDKWVFEDQRPARRMSFRECARIQGFPKAMAFPDTAGLTERYKVVGNAVPPPLFHAVANVLTPQLWN
jgi:DNA (cytosine-5)-methyltransferase 1